MTCSQLSSVAEAAVQFREQRRKVGVFACAVAGQRPRSARRDDERSEQRAIECGGAQRSDGLRCVEPDGAAEIEPTSQHQPIGGVEEDVDHDRVLQMSGHITDKARDDRPDPRVIQGVARKTELRWRAELDPEGHVVCVDVGRARPAPQSDDKSTDVGGDSIRHAEPRAGRSVSRPPASVALIQPDQDPIGASKTAEWEALQKMLVNAEFQKANVDVSKAFTNAELPQ
jgi:hypothetical protein